MVRDVSAYLWSKEGAAGPPLANSWAELDDLYSKRLWHELTIKLLAFVRTPELQTNAQLVDLYDNFIQDIEMRINPLALMEILALVVVQIKDAEQAVEFLTKAEPKIKANPVALALCWITKGQVVLSRKGDVRLAKDMLETVDQTLGTIDGISEAHGRFYLLQSLLYKTTGETALYYKSALKFLGCTKLSDLSQEEQREHAKHLSIAALVAEGIYNFGELLAHPVLTSLKGTHSAWLVDLLAAFNSGDIQMYEKMKKQWMTDPTLKEHEAVLKVKIQLLGLMEMTFKRDATMRQLTFKEISDNLEIQEEEVEKIVMKAIAKGLVDGTIDEVAKKVHMTWVQPRVLDRSQIGTMISRLDEWKKEIRHVEKLMEDSAHEILLS